MPELPEVETVRAGLERYVVGAKISAAQTFHPRALKTTSIATLKSVIGAKIIAVNRRGKFLWFELDREFALVAHLGMSGQLLVQPITSPKHLHLRANLVLGNSLISPKKSITDCP